MAQESGFKKVIGIYTDKSINGWVRGLAWVGTLAALYIIGHAIYVKLFPSADQQKAIEDNKTAQSDLNNLTTNNVMPTYQDTQYNDWASVIADAYSGCDMSSILGYSFAFETVNKILDQLNNDADFLKLQLAYGIRTIPKGWLCGGDYTNLNLIQATQRQLTNLEINGTVLSAGLNKTLADKGIKYRFSS